MGEQMFTGERPWSRSKAAVSAAIEGVWNSGGLGGKSRDEGPTRGRELTDGGAGRAKRGCQTR